MTEESYMGGKDVLFDNPKLNSLISPESSINSRTFVENKKNLNLLFGDKT